MSPNCFDYMKETHITLVWDLLEEKFGFPKKTWTKAFKVHLDKQPRTTNDLDIFLKFGNQHINPILNAILLRRHGYPTFNNICEYIIRKSPSYINELNKHKRK